MSAAPAVSAESSSSGESASATTSATTKPPTKAAIHRNFAAERQDPPEKVKEAFDASEPTTVTHAPLTPLPSFAELSGVQGLHRRQRQRLSVLEDAADGGVC
jgi:hypothetical protein